MNYILQTPRLQLREFNFSDAEFIIKLVNSDGWLKFIGDRNIKTSQQARDYLENGPMKSYRENGFGLWMVELNDSGIPIGMCGLIKRDNLDHPDIGFAFLQEFAGKGHGFEIAGAVMGHARKNLFLKTILAITVPNNVNSIKLIEKLGLKYVKSFKSEHEDLLLYSG
ncbi:MAG: GNAT family N-acetyltransferase [Bacteroidota bacterium]